MAGGRLYWPLERALHTDVNYIWVSLRGQLELLTSIFGKSEPEPESVPRHTTPPLGADGKPIVLTPQNFDVVFGMPNNLPNRKIRRKL